MDEAAPVVEQAAPVAPPPADPSQSASGTESPAGSEAAPPSEAGNAEPKPETKPERLLSQDEVNRIVRRERRAAEDRAYSRALKDAEIERLRAEVAAARGETPNAQKGNGERPRPENFKDWDAYNEALVEWKFDERIKKASEGQQRQQVVAKSAEYAETVKSKLAAGEEKYEDFLDAISAPGVVFTDPMVDALLETASPHDVAYFLGTHPKESQRIGALSPAAQVREIDKIAATLTKPPAPTSAPAPIKPNAGSGGVDKTLETAGNYKEWLKVRERQLAK